MTGVSPIIHLGDELLIQNGCRLDGANNRKFTGLDNM